MSLEFNFHSGRTCVQAKSLGLDRPVCAPDLWPLDPHVTFLNHGSFGSCPTPVLAHQHEIQARLERQPMQFFVRDLEGLLDAALEALGKFVGAPREDLAFVPNATAGVNCVLRSLRWQAGDELLVTDHEYNACRNALNFVAAGARARVIVAQIPFPLRRSYQALESILDRVTRRTRLVLLDHVTSQTGLVLPIGQIATELARRGIDLLVDGAHAPGMIALNLAKLGATFYTGNCHKWVCAPKGAGFLYVQRDRQPSIRPLAISHGANSPRRDRPRFAIEFGWTGTWDPSAYLSVPYALEVVGRLHPQGWPGVMSHNHQLALAARKLLCQTLRVKPPCPDSMIGSLASLPLPDATDSAPPTSPLYTDPLQERLHQEFSIETPIIPWPAPPKRLLRISAQLYNALPQYERLASALSELLNSAA